MFAYFERSKKRSAALRDLASKARRALNNGHPGWSLPRATRYGESFADVVPILVDSLIFNATGPALLREAWKLADKTIEDLAAFLCWRLALLSFQDFADNDESARQMLMDIAGTLYPPSDRCIQLIERWYALGRNPSELRGKGLGVPGDMSDDEVARNFLDFAVTAEALGLLNVSTLHRDEEDGLIAVTDVLECGLYFRELQVRAFSLYRDISRYSAEALPVVPDPYCPAADSAQEQLVSAVKRSPERATPEIGEAALAVHRAYQQCAEQYLQHGDEGSFLYAVMQGAPSCIMAIQNYHALGDRDRALDIAHLASERVRDALVRTADADVRTVMYRQKLAEDKAEIDRLSEERG